MILVHHLEHSRSQRILWLLEEMGVEYDIRRYARDPKTSLAPAALKAVHPLGKSPVISHDDVVVAESGAIVEYLLDLPEGAAFRPAAGTPEHRQYRYWLHYAEGSLAPLLVMSLIFNRIETAPMPFFIRPIAKGIAGKVRQGYLGPNLQANIAYLAEHLADRRWFCGEQFTGADIMLSFGLEAAASRADLFGEYPRLGEVLQAMHDRPAYQRALERGGPYNLLG